MGSQLINAVDAAYPSIAKLYAQHWATLEAAFEGYYVGQGGLVAPSGTAGKLDMAGGTDLFGTVDGPVAAVTAHATTITSLAPSSGNEIFVLLEVNSAGALQFNAGSAAPFDSAVPPALTAGRVAHALLYIRSGATAVDTALSSANGNAKLIDLRVVKPGPSPTGWQYDQNTWVYASATSFTIAGVDATGYLKKGTKVSYNDGAVDYGYVISSVFSTDTTVTLATNASYSIANATLTAPRFSNIGAPQGHPIWLRHNPTYTGFGAGPSDSANMPYVGVTITFATDVFAFAGHALANNDTVYLQNIAGGTSGLSTTLMYYVITAVAGVSFQLSLTLGGAAVNATGFNGTCDVYAASTPSLATDEFKLDGTQCTLLVHDTVPGVSNSATFQRTLPVATASTAVLTINPFRVMDNGTTQTAPGSGITSASGANLTLGKSWDAGGAFTTSGPKKADRGMAVYQF